MRVSSGITTGGLPGWARDRFLAAAGWLTSPLQVDDYLGLIDPLLSARHPAGRVTAVQAEAGQAATLTIRAGRGWAGHRAGQYLPVGVTLGGVQHWRTYSITSPPSSTDRDLTITVKAHPEGLVSRHLVQDIRPGAVLRLGPAQGDFVLPPGPSLARPGEEPAPQRMLMVTAGSGITPVMGMLRELRRRRGPGPLPDVMLLHSAPGPLDCLFRSELTDMASRLPWFRLHEQYTRCAGRLTPEQITDLCPDWGSRETWACGPTSLLDALQAHWATAGIAGRLHLERFQPTPLLPPGDDPPASAVPVHFLRSGVRADVGASVSLLEAGEAAGVVMPYGCRRGICFGCLVPLVRGRVRDLRTGAVREAHSEPGTLIQTCVSAAAVPVGLDL